MYGQDGNVQGGPKHGRHISQLCARRQGAAHRLADALGANGWSVWWDAEIRPGETWDQLIEHELRAAQCVVVLWSKRSICKEWVRVEASEAVKRRVLIPVLIDAVEPPLAFRLIQAASLVDWRGDQNHPGLKELIGAIARLAKDPNLGGEAALTKAKEALELQNRPIGDAHSRYPRSSEPAHARRALWPVILASGGVAVAAGMGALALTAQQQSTPSKPAAAVSESEGSAKKMLGYEFGPGVTQGWEAMPQTARDDLVRQMAEQRKARQERTGSSGYDATSNQTK